VKRAPAALAVVAAGLVLAGCESPGSMLDPKSEPARAIATLWWWMFAVSVAAFLGTTGLLVLAYVRRRRGGLPVVGEREDVNRSLVILFGIAIPVVALIAVFTIANFAVAAKTDAPPRTPETLTIEVTGRQWWWEAKYPASGAVTANEMHIPVRTPVDVVVQSTDVIHSFWVPQLNRKIDMIPGITNRVRLYTEEPGRYQGQCAEYCGIQHTRMRLAVVAEPAEAFQAWERSQAADRVPPQTEAERRGEQAFVSEACAGCHQIRGTSADGRVGPDLTHMATRATLAALTIPNTEEFLSRWIRDPQHIKPGNRMPGLNLPDSTYADMVAYLRSLK